MNDNTEESISWLNRLGGRSFLLYLVSICLFVVMYWSSFAHLAVEWQASLYSHGWLVSALFFYYLSKENGAFDASDSLSLWLGAVVVFGSGLLLWVSQILSILTLQFVFMYGVIFGLALALWGWRALWQVKYIFIALAIAVPVWQVFQPLLRVITTEVTYQLVALLDIPVFRDKYTLTLPGGRFHVERACAGLSFVLTGTSLVFIFAAWSKLTFGVLLRLLLVSTAIAILANWIRVLTIVLVGNYTNMQSAIVHDHLTFGWVLFAVLYCPFYWWSVQKLGASESDSAGGPVVDREIGWFNGKPQFFSGIAILCMFFVLNAWFSRPLLSGAVSSAKLGDQVAESVSGWALEIKGVDASQVKKISFNGAMVTAYVAESFDPGNGESVIKSDNVFFDKYRWDLIVEENDDELTYYSLESSSRGKRGIAYSYLVGGRMISDWKEAKAQYLKSYFMRDDVVYLIAVMADSRSRAGIPKEVVKGALVEVARTILNRNGRS